MLNKTKWSETKFIVTQDDFFVVKEKIFQKLETLDNSDEDEVIMVLFYAVSSFETMVNCHLIDELKIKSFSKNDIDETCKLSTHHKLGWLLKLICGCKYTENKDWKVISEFIKARNFFIHYKPANTVEYNNHMKILNKESFRAFVEAAGNCDLYLKECHTERYKEIFSRIECIETVIKDKYGSLEFTREDGSVAKKY